LLVMHRTKPFASDLTLAIRKTASRHGFALHGGLMLTVWTR
jgi:hypothetical protein